MTYTEFLGEILKYAGIPALIAIGLKSSFDVKLENLKSDLNYLKSKENFKFTKLHERRFEVLQKTYQYVNENIDLLAVMVSINKVVPDGISEDEYEKKLSLNFNDSYDNFRNYYNINLIFFSEEIELLLKKYFKVSKLINAQYYVGQELNAQYSSEYLVDVESFSVNGTKIIAEQLMPIKKEIEKKFRELLGE